MITPLNILEEVAAQIKRIHPCLNLYLRIRLIQERQTIIYVASFAP